MELLILPGIPIALGIIILTILMVFVAEKRRLQHPQRFPEAIPRLIRRTQKHPSLRRVKLTLQYAPENGLFAVFLAALASRRCAQIFQQWLTRHEDTESIRQIALNGKGESFNGVRALELFENRIIQIRELAGHPEWSVRYMSLKMLLHNSDEQTRRALREMFHDPHSLIRRTAVEEYQPVEASEHDFLASELDRLLIDDYVYEVRTAAKARLHRDFPSRTLPAPDELSTVQTLHLVEQLSDAVEEDHRLAIDHLASKNREIQLQAALFAQRARLLERMLLQIDSSDTAARTHTAELLLHAASVGVVDFLGVITGKQGLGVTTLETAAEILQQYGPAQLIAPLTTQAAALDIGTSAPHAAAYTAVIRCACIRGDAAAASILKAQLLQHRAVPERIRPILMSLSGRHADILVPALLELLQDAVFPLRNELETAFEQFEYSQYFQEIIAIVTSDRQDQPHSVRISAFLLLGKLRLPYTLQSVLEHLPILPLQLAREFAGYLAEHEREDFSQRVLDILNGEDGKVRAAVIASIPATGNKDFLKPIREALTDADPLVRSASAWALMEYGDTRSLKDAKALLRDPVAKVRREAALALGSHGNDSILKQLAELSRDPHEIADVRAAAVTGLRSSAEPLAVTLLADMLNAADTKKIHEAIVDALAEKTAPREILELVNVLKDADTELRSQIMQVFHRMGAQGEEALIELLQEDIASLRPHITDVLQKTGCIDATVRQLSQRHPASRRTAAERLALIGTEAAYRGIVVAARDPDVEVRVMVTKALERLASPEGSTILQELEQDPEKRIRKYTLWAVERIKAGSFPEEKG